MPMMRAVPVVRAVRPGRALVRGVALWGPLQIPLTLFRAVKPRGCAASQTVAVVHLEGGAKTISSNAIHWVIAAEASMAGVLVVVTNADILGASFWQHAVATNPHAIGFGRS